MSSSRVDRQPPPKVRPRPTTPPRPTTKPVVASQGQSGSLGTTGWIFVGLGASIVTLVLLSCIYIAWRSARRASQPFRESKRRMRTGRGIERPSFLPFRFTRTNEPVVLELPDTPDLPNYAIRTPYTFPSSIFSATPPGSGRTKDFASTPNKGIKLPNDMPSCRATIS